MRNGLSGQSLISRFSGLAIQVAVLIKTAYIKYELQVGQLLGRIADGSYRAYAEAEVGVAFSAAAATFTLDATGPLAKHFQVGDTVTDLNDATLGVIESYDPETGVGTLTGNSASAHAIGERVKIKESECSVGGYKARFLSNVVEVCEEDGDAVESGLAEGFIVKSELHTDHIVSVVGYESAENEIRVK